MVEDGITRILFVFATISNCASLVRFFRRLRVGCWPRTADFASVSVALFYCVAAFPDFFDPRQVDQLRSLFSQPASIKIVSLLLIAGAPWLLQFGSYLISPHYRGQSVSARLVFPNRLRRPLLLSAILICIAVAESAIKALMEARSVWTIRIETGEAWGPLIIWFYTPLAVLALLISSTELRSLLGRVACAIAFGCSILAAIPVGERTLVLLPILILLMFTPRLSTVRFFAIPAAAVLGAALLLPTFKSQFGDSDASPIDLIASTVRGDLSRTSVLGEAIARSDRLGSHRLPYPMAGYLYSAALFVPRALAPWKGYSAAQALTGDINGTLPDQTYWGYGLGLLEDAVVNGGVICVVPVLLLYGIAMGLLDRVTYPPMVLTVRLSVLWIAGYTAAAVLQTFGPMALVAVLVLGVMRANSSICHIQPSLG